MHDRAQSINTERGNRLEVQIQGFMRNYFRLCVQEHGLNNLYVQLLASII